MAWFRHDTEASSAQQAAEAIRGAIVDLVERRDEAAASASAALLGQAEVQHALLEQRRRLQLAAAQLGRALTLARGVADDVARDDGERAALPFRGNVEGLQSQRDVVVAALGQLDQLQDVSHGHVGAAREVLVRSRAVFDEALRDELRLLVTLERLERSRVLLASRSQPAADERD